MIRICYNMMALLIASLLIALAGCGFRLQGSMQQKLPPQLHSLYLNLNAPYSSFSKRLKRTLSEQKISLVDTPEQAPLTLTILNTQKTTGTVGNIIATTAASNAYHLTYHATFSLSLNNGEVIIPTETTTASEVVSLPANTLVSNSDTAENVYNNLEIQVIEKIIRQLSSPQTITTLEQITQSQQLQTNQAHPGQSQPMQSQAKQSMTTQSTVKAMTTSATKSSDENN